MTVRTILVSVDGTESSKPTLDSAFMVAKKFGVHVDVLHVRPDSLTQVPAIGEGMSAKMADNIAAISDAAAGERAMQARGFFEEACRRLEIPVVAADQQAEGVSATWIERIGRKHKHLIRLGRVHDLVILGHPSDPKDMENSTTVQALFESGRPVLVVPKSTPEVIGRKIAIAWNGSAECARALGGATNFFMQAEEVVILTAHSQRTPVSVVPELENYLDRHGVKAETRIFANLDRKFMGGRILLDECTREGVDMLVMGAFKISRLRQLVLGNATRDVLESASIPVLMGH